jgi:TolB-like protein/class 3 adenylate cyclase/lipopolysaccharide biosynthesis regulator YciM
MSSVLNRKLSIVFFSDIVGYTKLMGRNEEEAFELVTQNLKVHSEIIAKYKGQIIKELGDGILGTFENAEDALDASIEIQKVWISEGKLELRIGLHCGEVIFDHGDVFGDAVNIAARIQGIGIPSCVIFSDKVHALIKNRPDFTYNKLGVFQLKNVEKDIDLYALTNSPCAKPERKDLIKNIRSQEKPVWKFWVGVAATFSLLLFLIYSFLWNEYTWEKDKSVAVLPFTNIVANPNQEYFAEGLTEDIIYNISKLEKIKVIDKSAVYDFKESEISLDSIATILNVSTIVKGSIQWIGENIRINIQMIDPIENKNLWNETYNREVKDIFKVQSEIAAKIATTLNYKLSSREKEQLSKEQTNSFEAYELYLKGKESFSKFDKRNTYLAIDFYKDAIEIDPNYASAYSSLADSYARLDYFGEGSNWLDSSLKVSEKALSIDPYLEEAFKSRGAVFYYEGQIEYAQMSFEKALVLNPNYSAAIGNLATVYMTQGKLIEALKLQLKSTSLNPTYFVPIQITGWIYRLLNQPTQALDWLQKANSINFDPVTAEQIAYVLLSQNKKEEALKMIDIVLDHDDSTEYSLSSAGYIAIFSGENDLAFKLLEQAYLLNPEMKNDKSHPTPIFLAYLYLQTGNLSAAESLIKPSLEAREKTLVSIKEDHNLWLDLAQLEALRKNESKVIENLNQAFKNGFRDDFYIINNPIFKDYLSNPEIQNVLNQIIDQRIESNMKIQSNKLELR